LQGVGGGGLAPWSRPFSWTRSLAKAAAAFALYSMASSLPLDWPALGVGSPTLELALIFFITSHGCVLILTNRLVSDPPEFTREVESAGKAAGFG